MVRLFLARFGVVVALLQHLVLSASAQQQTTHHGRQLDDPVCQGGPNIVETQTELFLTLTVPFDQITATQRSALEAACVAEYNALSLQGASCAPDTTLAVSCVVSEYAPTDSGGADLPSLPQALLKLHGWSTLSDNAWFEYSSQGYRRRRQQRQLEGLTQLPEFCDCQNNSNESSKGIDLTMFVTNLAAASTPADAAVWVLDGQEVTSVSCDAGTVLSYDAEFFVEEDASQWTTEVVTEFEQLFHGECNRWSVQECDPQNFVVLSTALDTSTIEQVSEQPSTRRQRHLQADFSLFFVTIVVVQHNGPFESTPSLFTGDVRKRVLGALERQKRGIFLGQLWPTTLANNQQRQLQKVGDTVEYPCYCEIRRAPDGVPIVRQDVTVSEVNSGLDLLFDSGTKLLSTTDTASGDDGDDDDDSSTSDAAPNKYYYKGKKGKLMMKKKRGKKKYL